MKVSFDYLPEFERRAKELAKKYKKYKKYKSFGKDYHMFLDELEQNPFSGESLGHHVYKNRMAIASKGKGKSGGARVITYNLQQNQQDEGVVITLMSIYDKSDIANVSDEYLRSLVRTIEHGTKE